MTEDTVSVLLSSLIGGVLALSLVELYDWLGLALLELWNRLENWYWHWRWYRQWQRTNEDELAEILGISREDLPELRQRFAEAARIMGIPSATLLAGLCEWSRLVTSRGG